MKYVLNPQYVLRHGGNKSFIISSKGMEKSLRFASYILYMQ